MVGYIGSLRALEGVDFTAKAVAKCARAGLDIRFLYVVLSQTASVAESVLRFGHRGSIVH